jgi:hypothetical protein
MAHYPCAMAAVTPRFGLHLQYQLPDIREMVKVLRDRPRGCFGGLCRVGHRLSPATTAVLSSYQPDLQLLTQVARGTARIRFISPNPSLGDSIISGRGVEYLVARRQSVRRGLNLRLPACKTGATTTELRTGVPHL